MRKLLNNPWVVGALALVAFAFVWHSVSPRIETGPRSLVSAQLGEEVTTDSTAESPAIARPPLRLRLEQLVRLRVARDPFALPAVTAVTKETEKTAETDFSETVHVSAIWIQGGATYVLLDQKIATSGDKIGRFIVDDVTRDGVWLRHWKGRDFVSIGSDFTLVTPARQAAALALSTDG